MAAVTMLDFQKFEIFVRGQCVSLCQISSKSVTLLQRYGDFTVFKMAAVCHRGFLKVGAVKRPIWHQRTKFRKHWSNHCGDITIFCDFQDSGRSHLGFSKIQNFNDQSTVWAISSLCQISSKSVKRFQRYGDLTVFKMPALRHFGFGKFEFFNSRSG